MSFQDIMKVILPVMTMDGYDYVPYVNGGTPPKITAPDISDPLRSDYDDTSPRSGPPSTHGGIDFYYYRMNNGIPEYIGPDHIMNTYADVHSPVDGTVIEFFESTGGISILLKFRTPS